jgi:uncharacterized protein YdbL (DUF1318 family)
MARWGNMIVLGAIVWSMAGGQPLLALTLEEAKTRGLVGEKSNGYLGVVAAGNAEAQALANDINQKRRQAYQEIARRDGTNLRTVETLAGEKAIEKTKPGNMIEGPGGWIKK